MLLGRLGQGSAVCLEVTEANVRLLCGAWKPVCSRVLCLGGWEHQPLKSLTSALSASLPALSFLFTWTLPFVLREIHFWFGAVEDQEMGFALAE